MGASLHSLMGSEAEGPKHILEVYSMYKSWVPFVIFWVPRDHTTPCLLGRSMSARRDPNGRLEGVHGLGSRLKRQGDSWSNRPGAAHWQAAIAKWMSGNHYWATAEAQITMRHTERSFGEFHGNTRTSGPREGAEESIVELLLNDIV